MLELCDVVGGYGDQQVLHRISFRLPPGSLTVIWGINGSGKSTLLRTIAGEAPLFRGSIKMWGCELGALSIHERACHGMRYVPDSKGLCPSLKVRDHVGLAAYRARSKESAAFDNVFGMFPQLSAGKAKPAGDLSGGQQQMLAIACALVGKPPVVVVDEMSNGFHPAALATAATALRQRARDGGIVLLTEQTAERLAAWSDMSLQIHRGELVA